MIGTLLGALLAWSVFIAPDLSLQRDDLSSILSVGVYVALGLLFARLFEQLNRVHRHSAARAAAIFERAPVGMAELGLDGRWRQVNDRFCEILGYSREELLALGLQALIHPDELAQEQELRELRDRLLSGELPALTRDRRFLRKDGSTGWLRLTINTVSGLDAAPGCFISVIEDITAARLAEAALREREQSVSFALETSQIGTWDVDVQAHTAQHSPLVERIFGYEKSLLQWNGEVFLQHVHPEDRGHVAASFRAAVAQRSNWDFQCRIRRADGALRWIWVAGRCTGDDAGPLHLAGVVQDITERKQDEIELQRQTQELRRRNQELERFDRASVGRELRMVELKRRINALNAELGREPEFEEIFSDDADSVNAPTGPGGAAPGGRP